jgi:hypothetical protein
MKRLAGCLALVAMGLMAAAAFAATEVTRFQSDLQSKKPGKSTSLKVGLGFADPDRPGQEPESLDHFTIRLNRGTELDAAGAPACDATAQELETEAGKACPDSTRIGGGSAHAINDALAEADADVTIHNLTDGRWLFTVFLAGTDAVVDHFFLRADGNKMVSGTLNRLPGGFHTQTVDLTFEKHSYRGHHLITTPAKCPRRHHWNSRGVFTFKDGTTVRDTDTTRCRRAPRRTHGSREHG